MDENIDLYEVLGVESKATKAEIKKAYHKVRSLHSRMLSSFHQSPKIQHGAGVSYSLSTDLMLTSSYAHQAALSSHPDKVPETERGEAEIRFKAVSQAYEILYDG